MLYQLITCGIDYRIVFVFSAFYDNDKDINVTVRWVPYRQDEYPTDTTPVSPPTTQISTTNFETGYSATTATTTESDTPVVEGSVSTTVDERMTDSIVPAGPSGAGGQAGGGGSEATGSNSTVIGKWLLKICE